MELVNARTLTSKTFDLGSGRRRLTTAIGPVHYRVDPLDVKEPWKDIDRTLRTGVGGIECLTNTYQIRVDEKDLRGEAEFSYRGKKMRIAPVALEYRNAAGATQTIATVGDVKPVVAGNSVTWPDVFGKGIDFGYTVSHLGFQKVITVHQTESLPTPKIDSKGLRLCAVLSMAWDSTANAPAACAGVTAERVSADFSGQEISLITAASKDAPSLAWEFWKLHPARAWDAGGKEIAASLDIVNRGGRPFAVVGVAMADLEGAKFPVSIDPTLDPIPVADGGDDGNIHYGNTLTSSGNQLEVGDNEELVSTSSFMRFTNVAIPAGATIDAANIVVVSIVGQYDGGATPSGSLKGRKVANCPQITTIANYNDTTTYPRTTANVTWWPSSANWGTGANRTSPELKTVVQEIVDLAGWASGNAIQIEWHYINNGWHGSADEYTGDYRYFYSYEHATYNPPILNVEYTGGAAAGNPWWYYRRKRMAI